MSQADPNAYPVTFFGKMLTFSRIKLTTNDFDVITAHLAEVSPNKDSQIPIIIDSDVEIDLKQLIDLLWEWGLQPIGITRGLLDEQANELRVAIFPADGKRMKRVAPQSRETDITNAPITPMQARFAKQIENLKKGVVADDSNDNGDHDNDTEQNQAKSQENNHETEQPKTDNNIDNTTSNTTNNTTDSKPTALEPKKNVLLKTQQTKPTKTRETKTETSPKAETGASTETDSKEGTGASTASPTTSKTVISNSQDFIEAPQALDRITSKVHEPMLRSGQNVNHVGGDLILMNSVNDGAEAITDNNLHVYGKGMGRLIAGATGDPDAKIFCQCFNPSLVSVAGTYMLRDNLPPEVINKAVQVSYKEDEGLVFKIMDDWSQAIEQNSIKASKH